MIPYGWVLLGLGYGAGFVGVGVIFVALSLFTGIERSTWELANLAKGTVGFGLCGLAGIHAARRIGTLRDAAQAGALAGTVAGIVVPAAIYIMAYGGLPYVQQFPFEYYSMQRAGSSTAVEYLESPGGRATVKGTTLGLIPIVTLWAAGQGALIGLAGASIDRWLRRERRGGCVS